MDNETPDPTHSISFWMRFFCYEEEGVRWFRIGFRKKVEVNDDHC